MLPWRFQDTVNTMDANLECVFVRTHTFILLILIVKWQQNRSEFVTRPVSTQPQQPKKKGSNSMQISNLIGSSPAPMTQPSNMMSAQPQQAGATIGGNQQAAMVGQGSFGQPTTVQLVNNQVCSEVVFY